MSRPTASAARRTAAIGRHLMSTSTPTPKSRVDAPDEAPVLFESNGSIRSYILNRPAKLNALNEPMLNILRPQIEEWCQGQLAKVIVGRGVGRAFCAGGDVESVVRYASEPETRPQAIDFFHREFEMDYILAAVPKPYVAVMDGITMGGGVGLSVNAQFRIATEKTIFAMPETKIGYCPDVGASYFLSRIDGEIGTYLGLTGDTITGRAVYDHGFATHYIPSRRIPALMERLASLEEPTYQMINDLLEEESSERESDEVVSSFVGAKREALDSAFRHNTVEEILAELTEISKSHQDEGIRTWAAKTLEMLADRSPTSLKVALAAIRKGKQMNLLEALQMEMNIATAFCSGGSPDFHTGVTTLLVEKEKSRPAWSPAHLSGVNDEEIRETFFSKFSPENDTAPKLTPPVYLPQPDQLADPMQYALPTEAEIGSMVDGSHRHSGATEITLDELLEKFDRARGRKAGMREKILEVVQRKCVSEQDKHMDKRWLKWKH
ncbi:3-hydroxyisobutyryl-coenzyme A hydrolase [Lentinus tigrinus ALCF2SS1-7]|uniref:3-hydroxyisobutyryl-CoA hydrolase n=1 Tax=Lentinus tigrinus ALCF2SS1-6 TaxID=1328759 RepID=A0A5C2SRH6_9APHY|nr:3-hydroxyisobutyryl-coenzyme A hydrolase [Lentinus tigrinus ALCF2SS1-6]RPD80375.1 3-hydroxyisobutyryl-coenzyme A hydrolase [Lentinus tigrinus ALCF2SS1-7]